MIWKNYQGAYIQVGQFKKQDELNCLDFVQETNQLLIGTGNGLVLTQNISEYLSAFSGAYGGDEEGYQYALGNGEDDYYDENQQD